MDTHSQEPVIRGYDPDSMQVQEIQLAAPSSANFSPHYEGVLREMRRHRTGVRTPPTAGATLTTTSDAAGTISSLSGGGPSKNIGAPRYSPRMDADEYVVIIKPRETCNLTQYRGTGSIGNAIRAAISQRSDNAEADPNLAHKYSLHPIWEQNLVVVGTKEERVLPILLGLDKLRLTDRTINVQAYLKATDNMGKGVIRLANTFTTDYILDENTTSPHNQIIGARRLGSTNVVALTFEHSNLPRCVFFLNEATLVQKYRKTNAICATYGKPGHRTDVCPAPVPENERCALCGKTGVDASQPHECHRDVCSVAARTLPALATARADIANQPPPSPQTHRPAKHADEAGPDSPPQRTERHHQRGRQRNPREIDFPVPLRESGGLPIQITVTVQGTPVTVTVQGGRSRSRSSGRRPAQQHTRQGQTTATPPVLKLTGPQVSWATVVASPRTQNSSRNTESPIIAQLQSTIEQQNRTLTQLQQLVAQQQQVISRLRQEIQGNKCPQTTPTAATSADCEMSPASSETPEPDTHITQRRNSLTTPTQASIVDLVDKALEQKLSAFTETITQTIEQSIMKHVSALEERNAKKLHELAMPYITQMQSIIAKHNMQVTQLNEGKHCKGVKLLSGRRDMPAAALSINPDSDDASTTPHDG
ncbi:hypothetical protein HPB49_000872 [Dermacentor silvarum]|uniref:Uncharacterized protein n=1 Tax=Dermacentor silvarum TaxID=543639 RepID=A0ACB8D1V6_DERSI|nr:hypothetical protein HPB49_000872 [Dermacentor silvarum]